MVKRRMVVLALALGIPLAACQPAEREAGGGAGEARGPAVTSEVPGDHFEEAYTNLAEAHINLVQGDWDGASEAMRDVRENLDAMKTAKGAPLPADVTNRVNDLERGVQNLDQLIASRNPNAVAQSRALMATFTQQSTLAQVGVTGGGAGAPQPKR